MKHQLFKNGSWGKKGDEEPRAEPKHVKNHRLILRGMNSVCSVYDEAASNANPCTHWNDFVRYFGSMCFANSMVRELRPTTTHDLDIGNESTCVLICERLLVDSLDLPY